MCVQSRLIRNKYTNRVVRVDCGKCDACLQAKALRVSNRIRNESSLDKIALFVTLTYENKFVPYIRKADLSVGCDKVVVWRDAFVNRRGNAVDIPLQLGEYDLPERVVSSDIFSLKSLNGKAGCVGVCYFKDVQDFVKRLRINLVRKYDFHETFSIFKCSEYGGHTQRPHFHLLIYIRPSDETVFRSAISESWPYGNKYDNERFIEVARDAASYVASYVNCGYSVSRILSDSAFRQKHSYSKAFGVAKDCFSLPEILSKVDRCDLHYFGSKIDPKTGAFVSIPIPKYVINRYFPFFCGFSRLTSSEVFRVCQCPSYLRGFVTLLGLTRDSVDKYVKRLYNCQQYFYDVTGLSNYDFAYWFVRTWTCYRSTVLKASYCDLCKEDFYEFYDNIDDYIVRSDDVDYIFIPSLNLAEYGFRSNLFKLEVNYHRLRVLQTNRLADIFRKRTKQKIVTNQVMSTFLNV